MARGKTKNRSLDSMSTLEKTVSFYALGCRANQLEASALADTFKENGWQVLPFEINNPAALYIINTCTVTHGGDSDSRRMIRRAISFNPEAKVAVTGCYAQVSPDEIAAITGVDYVIGNNYKQDIFKIITEANHTDKKQVPLIQVSEMDKSRIMEGASAGSIDRSRASLKIQDGCDFQCTYCIIWVARGKSRSLAKQKIREQLEQLLQDGFYEVVLTGINIGQYEEPTEKTDLTALLKYLTTEITQPFRLRLSSLDPFEVTPALIELVARNAKICPYFHLSIQSANDSVLKRMARRHHVEDVEKTCQAIKQQIPHAAIGADIIVGFPGETDAYFEETFENLRAWPVDYLHVFSYSKRKDTPAADFADQVSEADKKMRSKRLIALSKLKRHTFYEANLGQIRSVVIEQDGLSGVTENYIPVDLTLNHYESPNRRSAYAVKLTHTTHQLAGVHATLV